ncbi:MAG: amidohydrolase [Bacteroidota bacterium]
MPSKQLDVAIVQPAIIWENIEENLNNYSLAIQPLESDLVILPEMFNTGFTMNSGRLAEKMDGPTIQWMKEISLNKNIALAGSLIIVENDKFYNRFVAVYCGEIVSIYDKRHLFRMGNENNNYSAGVDLGDFDLQGWRIRPLICYDLRFPVWSRNTGDIDLMIYVANWPAVRQEVWNILLKARAIENQVYVAGVNRVGKDGNEMEYVGGSVIIDPRGNLLQKADDTPCVINQKIDLESLNKFREKFPVQLDADKFIFKT